VRDAVGDAVDDAVRGAVRGAVGGAVGDAVRGAVRGAVGGAVGDAVRGAVDGAHFLLQCALCAGQIEWGGNLWPGYMSWATFFRDVCDLEIEQADAFAAFEVLSSRCGFYSLHADFAMVSDRPRILKRDLAGRLHADNGPAIAWRDGWQLFYWHGLQIPRSHEWMIADRGRINPGAIDKEPNAELRRIMLEIYGFERYLAERGAKVVAEDELHGFPRRLLDVNVAGESILLVEVHNGSLEPDGSRRKFHLGAARNPQTRRPPVTPAEAIAASYGINPAHYREAVRS
jgi:hypothetical protein